MAFLYCSISIGASAMLSSLGTPDSLSASRHTPGNNTRLVPALVTSAPAYQPLVWRSVRWQNGACAGKHRDR